MTQKSEGKIRQDPTPTAGPVPEELKTAYQVHTLAQLMAGRFGMAQPWMNAAPFPGYPTMPGQHPAPWLHQGWNAMDPYATPYPPFANYFPMGFRGFPY